MSRFIEITPRARDDIRRILKWLRRRSPKGAVSWYQAFWDCATRLADNPRAFSVVDESPGLTRTVHDALFKTRRSRRYRIIFDFSDTEVFILRVRRPGQRPIRNRDLPSA